MRPADLLACLSLPHDPQTCLMPIQAFGAGADSRPADLLPCLSLPHDSLDLWTCLMLLTCLSRPHGPA